MDYQQFSFAYLHLLWFWWTVHLSLLVFFVVGGFVFVITIIISKFLLYNIIGFSYVCFGIGKGNWNYFAAIRSEKRAPKLEATHLEKAKELYTRVCFILSCKLNFLLSFPLITWLFQFFIEFTQSMRAFLVHYLIRNNDLLY